MTPLYFKKFNPLFHPKNSQNLSIKIDKWNLCEKKIILNYIFEENFSGFHAFIDFDLLTHLSDKHPFLDLYQYTDMLDLFYIPKPEGRGYIHDIESSGDFNYCYSGDMFLKIALNFTEASYCQNGAFPIGDPEFKILHSSPSERSLAILGEDCLWIYDPSLDQNLTYQPFYENYVKVYHWAGFIHDTRFGVVSSWGFQTGTYPDFHGEVVLFDFSLQNNQIQLQEVIELPEFETHWVQTCQGDKRFILQNSNPFSSHMYLDSISTLPQGWLYHPLKKRWEYLYTMPQHLWIRAIHALNSEEILILAVEHPTLEGELDWVCHHEGGFPKARRIYDAGLDESIVPKQELVVYQLQILSGQCQEKFREPLVHVHVRKAMINAQYFVIHGYITNDNSEFTDVFRAYRF